MIRYRLAPYVSRLPYPVRYVLAYVYEAIDFITGQRSYRR